MSVNQQIEELRSDLNAHRQGWVSWSPEVLKEKTALLCKLLKQLA